MNFPTQLLINERKLYIGYSTIYIMPRYTLIMSDELYVKLLQIAAKEGKTLGKFLNEVLEEVTKKYENK